MVISKENLRINDEIRAREVRLTADDGEQLGIMSSRDALALAQEKQLDLVEIAPNAKPPVCRIMDYGKYRYEQQKRDKEARKKQKTILISKKSNCAPASRIMTIPSNSKMQCGSWKTATK